MIELAQVLEQMIGVLADSGDTFWSGAIGNDLALLRKGDAYGAERFLTYFGGMGSINDVWLCEMNGHSVPKTREGQINAEFHALRERAWQLARAVVPDSV